MKKFIVRLKSAYKRRIEDKIIFFLRNNYNRRKRKRLININPSLITNNCSGGIICHDLGLKFNSPTVNLFMSADDFIKLVNNLEYYAKCEPIQVFREDAEYPVGILQRGGEIITLYFMHYRTFEEAKNKWIERGARIDYNNINIIFEVASDLTRELYHAFELLPYKNKVIITQPGTIKGEDIIPMDIYKKNFCDGKIFLYQGKFSPKRYLDKFDYVSFLNRNVKIEGKCDA